MRVGALHFGHLVFNFFQFFRIRFILNNNGPVANVAVYSFYFGMLFLSNNNNFIFFIK